MSKLHKEVNKKSIKRKLGSTWLGKILTTFFRRNMKNIILNIIGSSLLAFGVYAFVVPFDIIVGGATGLSIIGHKLLGWNISIIVLIINCICLPIGYVLGSRQLALGSILSSFVYPIALAVFERIPIFSSFKIKTERIISSSSNFMACAPFPLFKLYSERDDFFSKPFFVIKIILSF